MSRRPRRLDVLPDTGRVVLAHPRDERRARLLAERYLCDYLLHDWVAIGDAFWINVDEAQAQAEPPSGGADRFPPEPDP